MSLPFLLFALSCIHADVVPSSQDNVYARQVSLFDFNRIHLGCDLPGELNITLECQSRFVSDFNALATHVQSQSMEGELSFPFLSSLARDLNTDLNSFDRYQ